MAQRIDQLSSKREPVRGVGWVLRGAFVAFVFFMASVMCAQLLILTIAEQYLIQAARAGAREAALPRATIHSVSDVVNQCWRNWSHGNSQLHVIVRSENRVIKGRLPNELWGSIRVEVAVPASAILPHWIQFRWGPQLLHATASG